MEPSRSKTSPISRAQAKAFGSAIAERCDEAAMIEGLMGLGFSLMDNADRDAFIRTKVASALKLTGEVKADFNSNFDIRGFGTRVPDESAIILISTAACAVPGVETQKDRSRLYAPIIAEMLTGVLDFPEAVVEEAAFKFRAEDAKYPGHSGWLPRSVKEHFPRAMTMGVQLSRERPGLNSPGSDRIHQRLHEI